MVRDVCYIIKRIIIGVGIAICMYFFRNYLFLNTYAATLDGANVNTPNWAVASNYNNSALAITENDIYPNLSIWNYGYVLNKKVYISACTDMKSLGYSFSSFYNGTAYAYATAENIGYVANLTEKSCTFNNGYKGKVMYIKFVLVNHLLNIPSGSSTATFLYNSPTIFRIGSSEAFSFTIQNIVPTDDDWDIFSSDFSTKILESQNVTMINQNTEIINGQRNIYNTLNNDDTNEANSEGSSFFNNFQSNTHGLSGIVTAPLRLINSLSESTCSPLVLPLPFVNQNLTLPCMSSVYSRFPQFLTLYQLITTGLIGYYVIVNIFKKVRDFQNPNNDKVEVLEL